MRPNSGCISEKNLAMSLYWCGKCSVFIRFFVAKNCWNRKINCIISRSFSRMIPSLVEQLWAYVTEINTLKEADLCNSQTLQERIFVTTVHKAKGLEFDNVIIFDAVDGRYPNFYNQNNERLLAEDKRKFYVAMTRAKKRLYVAWSTTRIDYYNRSHPRDITPFMRPILQFFEE